MTKPVPRQLQGAVARVERARRQMDELRSVIDQFQGYQYDLIQPWFDEDKGSFALKMPRPDTLAVPAEASIIVGEVVYNLRSALDYLVYELSKSNTGRSRSGTQFVITDRSEDFGRLKKNMLKGLSPQQISIIEKLQPYHNVAWTKALTMLSNPDKHRELTYVNHYGEENKLDIVMGGEIDEANPPARVLTDVDGKGVNFYIYGRIESIYVLGNWPVIEGLEHIIENVRKTLERFFTEFQ